MSGKKRLRIKRRCVSCIALLVGAAGSASGQSGTIDNSMDARIGAVHYRSQEIGRPTS